MCLIDNISSLTSLSIASTLLGRGIDSDFCEFEHLYHCLLTFYEIH